jgi:hypothetical protein
MGLTVESGLAGTSRLIAVSSAFVVLLVETGWQTLDQPPDPDPVLYTGQVGVGSTWPDDLFVGYFGSQQGI